MENATTQLQARHPFEPENTNHHRRQPRERGTGRG